MILVTYYCVIYKQLDKVKDYKDWNEGVQMNIETEAPFNILVTEVRLQ